MTALLDVPSQQQPSAAVIEADARSRADTGWYRSPMPLGPPVLVKVQTGYQNFARCAMPKPNALSGTHNCEVA